MKTFKSVLLPALVLVLLLTRSASAQWVQTSVPFAGEITALAASGPNVYAGTYSSGVYHSTNNGISWAPDTAYIGTQRVTAVAIIDSMIFAGTSGALGDTNGAFIYRSTDSGRSWPHRNNLLLRNIAVDAFATIGSYCFAGTAGAGIYRSSNNGTNWTRVNGGLTNLDVISLLAVDTNLFAVANGSSVFLSTNNGSNWIQASFGASCLAAATTPTGTNLFAGGYGGVSLSTDTGKSWTLDTVGIGARYVTAIAVLGSSTSLPIIFAATTLGAPLSAVVFRSTDNGASWTSASNGLPPVNSFNVIEVSGSNLLVGTTNGLFLSTDSGMHWNAINAGITTIEAISFAVDGPKLFAGLYGPGGGGIYCSSNDGANWMADTAGMGEQIVPALAVYGTSLFAGTGLGNNSIYRSTDSGASWSTDTVGLNGQSATAFATTGTNLFAATGAGVFRSSDGGDTWTPPSPGLPTNNGVNDLTVIGTTLFAAALDKGVFRSIDDGKHWIALNDGLANDTVVKLAVIGTNLFAGTANIYGGVSAGGRVLCSTDDGTSWNNASAGLPNAYVRGFAVRGSNLFVATFRGLFLTSDNGAHWSEVDGGLPNKLITSVAVSGSDLYAGVGLSGVWRRPLSDMIAPASVSRESVAQQLIRTYPNPCTQSTTITFTAAGGYATVTVVDLLGEEIARVYDGELTAGEHSFTWDASGMPLGMYECIIQTGDHIERASMIVAR